MGPFDVFLQVTAKRKGFIKVAIETGACIVPVMAFGENEAFGGLAFLRILSKFHPVHS